MKHIEKVAKEFNTDLKGLKDHPQLLKIAMSFSNRIDLLEKFISENTQFDGKKVGFKGYPEQKEAK